jgi:Fe2+ transport system protein FeoA
VETDACAMEHALSDEAMDQLVRFIEFIELCPSAQKTLEQFRVCPVVRDGAPEAVCAAHDKGCAARRPRGPQRTLADLRAGEQGTVVQIHGAGAIRQRLLDMGILPGTTLAVERIAPAGGPVWIRSQGFQLSLRKKEAQAVAVEG